MSEKRISFPQGNSKKMPVKIRYPSEVAVLFLAALLAGYSCFTSLTLDHIADLSSALRLQAGQIPYQDFETPYGPISPILLSFFLPITPTAGYALLLASVLLNTFACFFMMKIVQKLGGDRFSTLSCGVLAAIWFLPPFGSYFHDHLAYCFLIFACFAFLNEQMLYAAIAFALSFHAKQTVGIIGIFCLCIALLFSGEAKKLSPKHLIQFVGYSLLSHFCLWAIIFLLFDFSTYWQVTFLSPASYSLFKADKDPLNFFVSLVLPFGINPIQMLNDQGLGRLSFYPLICFVYFTYFQIKKISPTQKFICLFFLFSTLFCAAFLSRSFTHVVLGMPLVWIAVTETFPFKWQRRVFVAFAGLGLLQIYHLHSPRGLKNQSLANSALFPLKTVQLRFSGPARRVGEYLAQEKKSYAVLDDWSVLAPYFAGFLPMNGPVLFFDGLVVPWEENTRRAWEKRLVSNLKEKNPEYIVRKKTPYQGLFKLEAFLSQHCTKEKEIPPFHILRCSVSEKL